MMHICSSNELQAPACCRSFQIRNKLSSVCGSDLRLCMFRLKTYLYMRWLGPDAASVIGFLQGLIVGFILLQYSEDNSWLSMGPFKQIKHLCILIHIINDEVCTVKLV